MVPDYFLLYSFPRVAITKNHKVDGLKKIYCLSFLESRRLTSGYQLGHDPSEGAKERSVPRLYLSF